MLTQLILLIQSIQLALAAEAFAMRLRCSFERKRKTAAAGESFGVGGPTN